MKKNTRVINRSYKHVADEGLVQLFSHAVMSAAEVHPWIRCLWENSSADNWWMSYFKQNFQMLSDVGVFLSFQPVILRCTAALQYEGLKQLDETQLYR